MSYDMFACSATGCELVSLDLRGAVCTLSVASHHLNAAGVVMGGALFTLADFAIAAAMNSECIAVGEPPTWVSTESHIHYIRPAKQGTLSAEAECLHQGRSTCIYRVTITDRDGNLVATVEASGLKKQS